jgi:hypothetical protein
MLYTNQYAIEDFSEQLLMSPTVNFNSISSEQNNQMDFSAQNSYLQYSSFYDYGVQSSQEAYNQLQLQQQSYQNQEEIYSYQNYQNITSCTSHGGSTSDFESEMDTSYNYDYQSLTYHTSQGDESMESSQHAKRKRKRVLNKIQRHEATMREKRRMIKLNTAFEDLRKVLPINEIAKNKISRAETLKSAIDYIHRMSQLLSLV